MNRFKRIATSAAIASLLSFGLVGVTAPAANAAGLNCGSVSRVSNDGYFTHSCTGGKGVRITYTRNCLLSPNNSVQYYMPAGGASIRLRAPSCFLDAGPFMSYRLG